MNSLITTVNPFVHSILAVLTLSTVLVGFWLLNTTFQRSSLWARVSVCICIAGSALCFMGLVLFSLRPIYMSELLTYCGLASLFAMLSASRINYIQTHGLDMRLPKFVVVVIHKVQGWLTSSPR